MAFFLFVVVRIISVLSYSIQKEPYVFFGGGCINWNDVNNMRAFWRGGGSIVNLVCCHCTNGNTYNLNLFPVCVTGTILLKDMTNGCDNSPLSEILYDAILFANTGFAANVAYNNTVNINFLASCIKCFW